MKGQIIRCSHPRLRHPVRPAEALAVSCNVWFATIGARLPRARLDGVLAALGLPPTPARAPMPLVATGLRAAPSPPLAWVRPCRVCCDSRPRCPCRARRGRRWWKDCAARRCTARPARSANAASTCWRRPAPPTQPAGGTLGVVVAAWPPSAPTRAMVLIAPGVAGKDAADLAAAVVANPPREAKPSAPSAERSEAPRSRASGERPPPPRARQRRARPPRRAAPSPRRFASAPRVPVGASRSRWSPSRTTWLACWRAKRPPEVGPRRLKRWPWPCGRSPSATAGGTSARALTCARSRTARCCGRATPRCARRPRPPRGQVLLVNGAPASVFHSASCGGRTERPSAVWPGADDPSYLPSKSDRACGGEPRWAAEIPVQDLERTLVAAGYRGTRLRDLEVDGRSASGRVARVPWTG